MNPSPIRVLCLDIEGGFGGSSRSLYESLCHIDRTQVELEVWCRRDGPIRRRYEALGIPCDVVEDMQQISALPRLSRNLLVFLRYALRWRRKSAFGVRLAAAANKRFDIVHFNHEGLFSSMSELRRNANDISMVAHIRTCLPPNAFSRWQYRVIARAADRVIFITENERENFINVTGMNPAGQVICNIARSPQDVGTAKKSQDHRLKIAVLSNFALVRGTDRIIEIAKTLASRGRRDILFVVAGDMTLRGSLPRELRAIAQTGGTLADYAKVRGVADMFEFLGHVADPESVLAGCDVLLKPTREDNPWGRDIIEALAFGKPVISVGKYDRFVENDKTGFLMSRYTDEGAADILLRLDSDRDLCRRLGENARARIIELCDGPSRARDLLNLWKDAIATRKDNRAA